MKTLQIICLSAFTILSVGCKKEAAETEEARQTTVIEKPIDTLQDAAVGDNSQNALDWPGTYSGTLPCGGDCKGIKTEITINSDTTYSLSSQALGRDDKPSIYKGTFSWDEAKSVITLDAEGDHLKFKVQEGSLKKLDKFGDPEQGGPQEAYILNKRT
ncbi:copper resistance protein NlpE [Flavobacterium sp. DGU11]|uniref:Copper resistance protein NlpE n=1 Tax=Flavobacterium arundinis TaxID=3139143 RepID=A0ABU9HYZ8_9FLAO